MTKTSKTILFFGNERLATGVTTTAPTLSRLIEAGYQVAAVISNYESGTSRSSRQLEIADVAQKNNIPLLLPDKPIDIKAELEEFGAAAAVLVAYGRLVPQSIIDIFPSGIINIHPSLLPLHRGPTPIESVILEGAAETGVSLMQLVREMDAGPVYAQERVSLNGNETKQDLADKLLALGGYMLIEQLPAILDGTLQPKPQDDDRATFDQLISKEDGMIDWRESAEHIEREIRAFRDWPQSRATLGGKDVIITVAHGVPSNDPESSPGSLQIAGNLLMVECGTGYLCLDRLKPAGKQEMSAEAFLAGYKDLLA